MVHFKINCCDLKKIDFFSDEDNINFSKEYQLKTLLIHNQSKAGYPTTKVYQVFFVPVLINNKISVHVKMETVYSCLSK